MSISIIQSIEKLKSIDIRKDSKIILDVIFLNNIDFSFKDTVSCILFKVDYDFFVIGVDHPDIVSLDIDIVLDTIFEKTDDVFLKFTFDTKRISHVDKRFLSFKCLNSFNHIKFGEIDENDFTFSHKYFSSRVKSKLLNKIIPISKHVESFMHNCSDISVPTRIDIIEPGFDSTMKSVIPQFSKLEKYGMYVDLEKFEKYFKKPFTGTIRNDNLVYSNYNIWSATGRPSNSFCGINFAALDKSNGERSAFISRFGKDGMMALFDFKAYHPRLLARLSNFEIPKEVDDIYVWLSRQMFNKTNLTQDELSHGKGNVFQQLYGKIEEKNLSIPYFRSIQNYMDQRWKYFNKFGSVDTPIYKRGITENHLKGAFSNKVVNYILQAYETERNCEIMKVVYQYLEDKTSVPVLYNYDSILFDLHKSDGRKIINDLTNIMEDGGFPVTVKIGNDFHDMKKI